MLKQQRPFLVEALTAAGLIAAPFVLPYLGFTPTTINRILQKRLVRDAAFSSFSFGYQWPREEDAPARPKSSGHH